MKNRIRVLSVAGCLLAHHAAAAETHHIEWTALRPAEQHPLQSVETKSAFSGRDLSAELGSQTVEITGYLLPSDREGPLVYEFMLVPWAGACSHTPAPPPNQVIRVTPDKPFAAEQTYQVVTVTGALDPGFDKAQLFIFDGVKVVESGYSISAAKVETVAGEAGAPPAHRQSPWSFLNK